jgi:hypothetical protein
MATQELVATPTKVAQYASRRSDLRLVKVPIYPRYGGEGRKVGELPGETVEFRNGLLTIDLTKDETVIAADHRVSTPELVEWLEEHRLLGDPDEGFFKVQVAEPPVSEDEISRLQDAAIELDIDTLEAMIAQEEAGWQRDAILRNARKSIKSIHEIRARAQAEAEAKVEAQPKAKAKPE